MIFYMVKLLKTQSFCRLRETNRGFTLIELLAVIAIIGILASVAIVSFTSAREKSRDGKRIAQVGQITRALELYYDSNQSYPSTTPSGYSGVDAAIVLLSDAGLLPVNLTPPPGVDLFYVYHGLYGATPTECDAGAPSGTPCDSYLLGITLERSENAVLDTDADVRTASFFGDSAECQTDIVSNEACYDVSP
jgi:prepilin-type N-terminal cleavage/methylation domain-containing protein